MKGMTSPHSSRHSVGGLPVFLSGDVLTEHLAPLGPSNVGNHLMSYRCGFFIIKL